ncbi:MAG: acetoin dehydrogenase dihydrolipoyllysine-residue acetyltransferase subunit [Pseudomonadota bacterium]
MPVEVILPKVDMDMTSGTIAVWHVAEGGAVAKGDPLFDIETEKAAMEVEAPGDGTLHHIAYPAGCKVPIGTTLAWIYADDEDISAPPAATESTTREQEIDTEPAVVETVSGIAVSSNTLRATPAARRLAREAGLALDQIQGTGPLGRVQGTDVQATMDTEARPEPPTSQTGDLHVYSSGTGDAPAWLMIHGFAADAHQWTPLADRLGQTAPIHRIDLPNHGRSPRRTISDFVDLVAQLRTSFDALGGSPVRLIGHSLGGAVALALADTRPRQIKDLTLIAPAGLDPRIDGDILQGIARSTKAESLGPWIRQLTGDPASLSDAYIRAAAKSRSDPAQRHAQTVMLDALFPDGTCAFDLTAALDRVTCPTRILWGRADRVTPWQAALHAPGRVALNLFDGIGHLPHVEAPDAVLDVLTQAP